MDDLVSKITELLSTEEGQKNVQGLMGSLGLGNRESGREAKEEAPPAIDPNLIAVFGQLMTGMKADDKDAALLKALKPHLSDERKGRVEEAMRILQLINLLPVLQKSGLFGGDLL